MIRKLLNWLFPVKKNPDFTIGHEIHWVARGSHDEDLHNIPPMDQAWLDKQKVRS